MFIESNSRSVVKAVSWRIFGTIVSVVVVYIFFNRLDLAIAAGVVEGLAKTYLFYLHERIWNRIKFGKKKIEPFVLWFTGIPLAGKTSIADLVYAELEKIGILVERLDSKDIRDLIPEIGFTRDERNTHLKRVGHLIKTLQQNSISVVASFVSPYLESRKYVESMTHNYIEIYVKCGIEVCKNRDVELKYERAVSGELPNFTGVSDVYEEPLEPTLVLDSDNQSIEDMAKIVISYIKQHHIKF